MLSQKIEVLLEEYANKPLSIEILLERTGELGFGLLTGFLTLPFTNLLPAYTILVLSVGSFESDGVFLLVGYGLTGATFFFFASIANVIWDLLQS
jgi:hypothetical protein